MAIFGVVDEEAVVLDAVAVVPAESKRRDRRNMMKEQPKQEEGVRWGWDGEKEGNRQCFAWDWQ